MNGIPNCVPEYYRSLQDDYDHEYELEMQRQEWYKENKRYRKQKYIEGCNELQFYPTECENCPHGEEAKPDSEWDDMPTMICSNWKNCSVYRNDIKEAFPDVPWEEYCRWREEYVQKLLKEMIDALLTEKVDEIFLTMQEKFGIKSGDVEPLDAYELNEKQRELTMIVGRILRKQI